MGATTAIRIVERLYSRPMCGLGTERRGVTFAAAGSFATMPDPWTTSASASLAATGGIVTLVEGSAFCISSRDGEIDPAHPQGLFFRDTRFLSEMRLALNGVTPEPLAATAPDPFSGVFVLRGRPSQGRADSHLVVFRRRYVGRGMREDVEIENF